MSLYRGPSEIGTATDTTHAMVLAATEAALAAAASAALATAKLNEFKGTWYGSFAADPLLDPLGNPPNEGDSYWNSVEKCIKNYNGIAWFRNPFEASVLEVEATKALALSDIANDVLAVETARVDGLASIAASLVNLALIPNRGAWVSGRVYAAPELALFSGTWYLCAIAHTSGATFAADASKWVVYQGVTLGDLAAAGGAALVGTLGGRTVAAKLADWVHVEDYGAQGGDASFNNVTAINAAFSAAAALQKPVLMAYPPYRIGSALTVPSGLTIFAAGGPAESSPLLRQTSLTANHMNITGSNLVVVGRLSFGHTGVPTGGICMNVTGLAAKNNNVFGMVDSYGCFELLKLSEGADGVHINHAKTRNAMGQLNVWGDSVYTGTPLYNRNLVIDYVDFENDVGVNVGINWNAMLQYCRDWKIGRLGGRINRGTDCFKCYVNDVPGVEAKLRWSEGLYFGPVVCTGQESDVVRIKEGDFVTIDGTWISDAYIGTGAVFCRGLYTDPAFGGNLTALRVKVTRIGQHGIYLRHLGPGRTLLDNCETSGNSTQTVSQFSNFLVDDGVSNWEFRGGISGMPSNAAKASTKLTLTGNPNSAYTMTLNGQALTFAAVAAGTTQIQLGDTARLTAINIRDFVNNSLLPEVSRLTATLDSSTDVLTFQLRERGAYGNAYTVVKTGSLMTWTGSLVSSTLLGGTGINQVSRNIYVNGATCKNYRIIGVDAKGGATANITDLGQGQVIDCIGVDNPVDVEVPFTVNGTLVNSNVNLGFMYGTKLDFIGITTSLETGSCSLRTHINGVATGGSAMALTVSQRVISAIAVNGGTGYSVSDTLVVSGGTNVDTAKIRVGSVDGSGRITSWSILDSGRYTVQPANAVATTPTTGTGVGATFNLGWSSGFTQNLSTPYVVDTRKSGASLMINISLITGATNLSGALLFRKSSS